MKASYVIGNWKLNPATLGDVQALASALTAGTGRCQVGVAPSFVHLSAAKAALSAGIWLGAQDIAHKSTQTGAFTGDVSGAQLADAGAQFVIVGHSERRAYHGESDAVLAQKITHAFASGLSVVFCIGETKDEYQAGKTLDVLAAQLQVVADFASQITADTDGALPKLLIAYEPVWAIGTGLTPTFAEVEAVHRFISETLAAMQVFSPILYGGSVNDTNAETFVKSPLIDGVLVGGASLKADSFARIAAAFA
ncbi:triose-phosphate isomerase [Moraxella caviae]|uniref:Triosephosphate isomerase n=1 Tax=Moraxella caviae TaxID=34060 RepID=A0A1T0A9D8_9GAMM|nr:triose-phosphate isomerase [Moraxella caviae]OOR92352.1 triose-phosphate isomerase [Moraxella caviae]STZ10584.1 Triosephosphate isomerase [Moraxella caviae]VEW10959.1 Triosephosphate isomerase [Moraxella caviae]